MSTATKIIVLVAIMVSMGLGLAIWKATYGKSGTDFSVITTGEMEAFLEGAGPEAMRLASGDQKEFERQVGEIFSIANAAKYHFKDDKEVMHSLQVIEMLVLAQNWDREKHKDSGPMPPFGFISQEQIDDYWGEGQSSTSQATVNVRKGEFDRVAKTQFMIAKRRGTLASDAVLDEESKTVLRGEYTKLKITEEEARAAMEADPQKWAGLKARVSIQVKLQQAQFLGGLFEEVLGKKLMVTEEEIEEYLKKNPGLSNRKEKMAKAQDILARLNGGADFAELAKEFSEDPGSSKDGGLIPDATLGALVPEYEKAALALKVGEYTKAPIETQFGFHIIKLEKKEEAKNASGGTTLRYDTRHILLAIGIADPSNPLAMQMPLEEYAKNKLEEEKKDKLLSGIRNKYPVTFEPYKVPTAPAAQRPAPMQPAQPPAQGQGRQ